MKILFSIFSFFVLQSQIFAGSFLLYDLRAKQDVKKFTASVFVYDAVQKVENLQFTSIKGDMIPPNTLFKVEQLGLSATLIKTSEDGKRDYYFISKTREVYFIDKISKKKVNLGLIKLSLDNSKAYNISIQENKALKKGKIAIKSVFVSKEGNIFIPFIVQPKESSSIDFNY